MSLTQLQNCCSQSVDNVMILNSSDQNSSILHLSIPIVYNIHNFKSMTTNDCCFKNQELHRKYMKNYQSLLLCLTECRCVPFTVMVSETTQMIMGGNCKCHFFSFEHISLDTKQPLVYVVKKYF